MCFQKFPNYSIRIYFFFFQLNPNVRHPKINSYIQSSCDKQSVLANLEMLYTEE